VSLEQSAPLEWCSTPCGHFCLRMCFSHFLFNKNLIYHSPFTPRGSTTLLGGPNAWSNVENNQGYNLPIKNTTFFSFLLSPIVKQPMNVLYALKVKCLNIDLRSKQRLFLKVLTFHAKAQYIYLKDPTFSDIKKIQACIHTTTEIRALVWNITHKSRLNQGFLPQRWELFVLRTQNPKEKPLSFSHFLSLGLLWCEPKWLP